MTELNGFEATRQIRSVCPEIEVLIFSFPESEDLIRMTLAAGARGFVLKTDAARLINVAIEALLDHTPFFTRKVSQLIADLVQDCKSAAATFECWR